MSASKKFLPDNPKTFGMILLLAKQRIHLLSDNFLKVVLVLKIIWDKFSILKVKKESLLCLRSSVRAPQLTLDG